MKDNKECFFKQFPELKDSIQWAVRKLEKRQMPWDARETKKYGTRYNYSYHYKVNLCKHN